MIQTTDRLGHIRELANRKVVFLAAVAGLTARTHEDAIHLVVKGSSASGKNELLRRVLALFPERLTRFLTGVSEQALVYLGGEIKGVLVFQEEEGEEHGAYQIRQAMSEGWLERMTVIDGETRTLRTYVRGCVFTTTTAVALHDENQTRVFDLHTDDSPDLTREILLAIAREAEGDVPGSDEIEGDLKVWRTALDLLESGGIVIPYASIVAEAFPDRPVRARRDLKRMFGLLRSCALLHQRRREQDDRGRYLVTLEDYRMCYPLIQKILEPTMSGLTEKAVAIDAALAELSAPQWAYLSEPTWVRRTRLIESTETQDIASDKTVRKWAERFVEWGYWSGRQNEKDRAWEYLPVRSVSAEPIRIPTPGELEAVLTSDGPDGPDGEEES